MSDHTYRLIEQFRHYNLTFLIPDRIKLRTDDDCFEELPDPVEDEYYDTYDYQDEELEDLQIDDDNDNWYRFNDNKLVEDLEELMQLFNLDYLEPGAFLSLNVWDLFGLTKKQFDLIDWDHIPASCFCSFYENFMKKPKNEPVEKRIRYSTADAVMRYSNLTCFSNDHCQPETILKYAEHIIDTHSFDKAQELISLLFDYFRFYDDAIVMNRRRNENRQPVFKYVFLPKPAHLKDLHDKAFRDYEQMETERQREDEEHFKRVFETATQNPLYRSMLYSDDKYIIKPVTCQEDLVNEGKYLDHCVASYGSFVASQRSYIYLIRKAESPDTPFFTAEVLPPESEGAKPVLSQLYTFHDSTKKTEEFRDFTLDWARKKNISIKCKI